jgi:selenide, water dikinase
VLSEILAASPATAAITRAFPDLMVGRESSDDAAVYRLNDSQALIATTDFFMPIVDDPFDFGRIAATNAISDVYAMGGTPIMALALVAMPVAKIGAAAVQRILAGGEAVCAAAGIPIAGGHSIDSVEPIYGLVVLGLVHPSRVKRNDRARAGDALVLGKGLGVGILSAALKKQVLGEAGYARMIASTTQLNAIGAGLAARDEVHALTDVTGFGLLGHALEMARGASLVACIDWSSVPVLPEAVPFAEQGMATGASGRNWQSYGADVTLPATMPEWQRNLLTDPQTSGGLLVACEASAADGLVAEMRAAGFEFAARVGSLDAPSAVQPAGRVVVR